MKRILTTFLILTFLAGTFGMFFASPVQAASSLYLSPSSKTIEVGSALSVQVRVNSGSVNLKGAQTYISYPTDKLKFVSIDANGSAFPLSFFNQESGGVVQIARTSTTSVSGDKLIATINFTGKTTGSASLSFTTDTYLTKALDLKEETSTKTGGTYTIKTKSTGGGGSTTTIPTRTSTTTAKKDTTPPSISGIQVSNIGFASAIISWKTNEKANSIVEYGPTKKLGLIEFNNTLTTSHKIVLPKKFLAPGMRIYYRVRSKDAAGNTASSKQTSFKTKGYSVKLRLLDLSGQPLEGAKATLAPGFDTSVADKNGFALFVDIAPGKHAVTIEIGDQKLAEEIIVEEIKDPEKTQEFVLKVAAVAIEQGTDVTSYLALLAIAVIVILSVTGGWMGRNYLLSRRRIGGGGSSGVDSPSSPKNETKKPADKDIHFVKLNLSPEPKKLTQAEAPSKPMKSEVSLKKKDSTPPSPKLPGQTFIRGELDLSVKKPEDSSDSK